MQHGIDVSLPGAQAAHRYETMTTDEIAGEEPCRWLALEKPQMNRNSQAGYSPCGARWCVEEGVHLNTSQSLS
jgi:hypothetical protein